MLTLCDLCSVELPLDDCYTCGECGQTSCPDCGAIDPQDQEKWLCDECAEERERQAARSGAGRGTD